jgi:4-amino-4-deoxy-L-arabinose transferase-like glycosyltransferase
MPPRALESRPTAVLRGACALAAAAALGAVVRPGPCLRVLEGLLGPPRDALAAEALLRQVALGGVAAGALLAAWLPGLLALLGRGAEGLERLGPRAFLALAAGAALVPRAFAALVWAAPATSDARWYHEAAASLASGQGFAVEGVPTAYRPPGYPFLLSLLYRAFGRQPVLAWIPGLLATALLLAAVHRLGRTAADERTARLGVLALALHPSLALATGQAMSDLPFAAALAALTAWLLQAEPWRLRNTLLLGGALGLLALTRSVGAAFLPALLLPWHLRRPDLRKAALHGGLAALVVFSALGAWAARNGRVLGKAVVATNVGLNLHIGNHPGAGGGYAPAPAVEAGSPGEAAADAAHGRAARAFLRDRPLEALSLLPKKLFHLLAFDLSAAQEALGGGGRPAWLKALAYGACQGFHLLLLGAFLAGLAALRRPPGLTPVGLAIGATVLLVSLATFGQDRFRMPFLPWMALGAAGLIPAIRTELRQ